MATGINQDRARGKSKGRGTGDDITQSTTDENTHSNPPDTPKQGRPKTIENPHRTTMTLEKRQVDHLDRICAKIKLAGGENLSRSNVVRALLDALASSNLEYSEIRSEANLREAFRESLL
jgi:hypothetical protein